MLRLVLCLALASSSALQLPALSRPASSLARTAGVSMMGRKGRPKMPAGGMMPQNQMQMQRQPPEDGGSMFYLYCRAERPDIWCDTPDHARPLLGRLLLCSHR